MKYYIYIHQNKLNKKIYVGYSNNPKRRWRAQKSFAFLPDYKSYYDPFYNAIRRDGWDNFSHEIIEELNTEQEAWDREMFYICFFRTNRQKYGPEWGYNLSDGGEHPEFSENTRKKMSQARKGRSDLTNSGSFKKGYKPWNDGKPLSDQHKENVSKGCNTKGKTWKVIDGKRVWLDRPTNKDI